MNTEKSYIKIDPEAFVAKGVIILGDVTIGKEASVWFHATIRGDRDKVVIGKGSNVQDNAVIHMDTGCPVMIGEYVTIGHSAIVHGCTIGNGTLIGMGAMILNRARIGNNCIIGAGALVTEGTKIPDNSVVVGCPGRIIKQVNEAGMEKNLINARRYIEEAKEYKMRYETGKEM